MTVEFRHHTLGNGLTIIAEVMDAAHSAAAGFFVKTGARDEPSELMGVSHFLEHMMFKGTESMSGEALNQAFDALGARHNAYTSNESTCFYAQLIPDALDQGLSLLATMMRPALRSDDFDTEKNVILEEIAMYADNPFWVLYEATTERLFSPHPLAHRVLGTNETITALQRDQMAAYFDDRYAADNTVLALAGQLDFERCVDIIEQHCGDWPSSGPSRDASPPPTSREQFTIKSPHVHRAYMLGLGLGPASQDDDRYPATIAAQLLGMPENSLLHWALIEPGLADEAQAAFAPHDGVGEFFVYCSCEPQRAHEVWAIVQREVASLVDRVESDALERLRSKVATAATVGAERPGDRLMRLGRTWQMLGEYRSIDDELSKIQAVSVDDVRATLDRWSPLLQTCGRLVPEAGGSSE